MPPSGRLKLGKGEENQERCCISFAIYDWLIHRSQHLPGATVVSSMPKLLASNRSSRTTDFANPLPAADPRTPSGTMSITKKGGLAVSDRQLAVLMKSMVCYQTHLRERNNPHFRW